MQGIAKIAAGLGYGTPHTLHNAIGQEGDGQGQPACGGANVRELLLHLGQARQRDVKALSGLLEVEVHGVVQNGEQNGPGLQIGDGEHVVLEYIDGEQTGDGQQHDDGEEANLYAKQDGLHGWQCLGRDAGTCRLGHAQLGKARFLGQVDKAGRVAVAGAVTHNPLAQGVEGDIALHDLAGTLPAAIEVAVAVPHHGAKQGCGAGPATKEFTHVISPGVATGIGVDVQGGLQLQGRPLAGLEVAVLVIDAAQGAGAGEDQRIGVFTAHQLFEAVLVVEHHVADYAVLHIVGEEARDNRVG